MAVKLFAHCETVKLLTADAYVLDLGPDHPPTPAGFLRLLTDTRLRQLKLILFTLLPTSILKPKGIRCRTCHSAGQQQRQEVCLHTLGRASFAMSFAMCMSSQ